MLSLTKLALISTAMLSADIMLAANADNIGADALNNKELSEGMPTPDQWNTGNNQKSQADKDLEAYQKSIGEDMPDGSIPADNPVDDGIDATGGHSDDPYWNYETGMDDVLPVDREWFWMFKQTRYLVYFICVAIPWSLFGAALVATNVVLNIFVNDGWAGGNVFLIMQTAYLAIQYFLSVLLYLEIDPWLKYMKFIRIGSLFVSWVYTLWYIALSILLVVILDDLDGAEVTYINMYTVMVLSYNLIFHVPVLAVNVGIILKEISMEFIQFCNDVAMTGMDDYSLATHNLLDLFQDLVNWINPWWWAEAVEDPEMWDDMYE